MVAKFLYRLFIFAAFLCLNVSCSDDDDNVLNIEIGTGNRNDDFVGRIYEAKLSSGFNYAKYELQFYKNQIVVERKFAQSSAFAYSEVKSEYDYNNENNILYIDGKPFTVISEEKLLLGDIEYNLTSTHGAHTYTPSESEDEGGDDDGGSETADFNVSVSPVSGAGEVNFVISVKDAEKEPSLVQLEYLVSPVELASPNLSNTRQARWTGHPTDRTWLYMTYVLGAKHSYVYYRVKVIVGSKVSVTPINYQRIIN